MDRIMTPVSDFVCIKLFVILIVYMVCIKLLDFRAVVMYHCPRAHRLFFFATAVTLLSAHVKSLVESVAYKTSVDRQFTFRRSR